MRRLSVAALSLSSGAALVAMLAVPASAHDGGRDEGRDGRGHDDAATAPIVAPAGPVVADDDSSDDAMEGSDDSSDDAVNADAASDDDVSIEATLTGSSVGGPVIAGAAAGGRPWVITEGEVEYEDGILTAAITGLVIPPGGTNPLASLSVSVVCGGTIAATSAAVPFSAAGNAMVSQSLMVPSTCVDPQVLVHPLTNTKVYIAFG